jgi:predicted metalloprotease with PDZ domain|tara:strand:+ start:4694 stop:6475 length:1782 start_codon:yes stop_codon:yes gene_type:complete
MIRYQITSDNPTTHYFDVIIQIDKPDPKGQLLRLPNWIPGSYMIRDFSRNIIDLSARSNTGDLQITQQDKSNWIVFGDAQVMTIGYKVYAKDLSVRGAHLDHSHGYYNGSSVFLEVVGHSESPCEILIIKPPSVQYQNWQVATSLPFKGESRFDFGLFEAQDYDDLIDHPVEMGEFECISFKACGVPHDVILTGRYQCDAVRLKQDLTKICEHHIHFFGEPAPMEYYQFQVIVVGDGYGGLEHRASTSLMCNRDSLPLPGQTEVSEKYRDFLGLCSHEYFHTWNVKRIKPAVYQPYDLQKEVYTELLWAFEGITSYYDDLALLRCGLIDEKAYLELLSQTLTRVERGLGRKRQSASESSFNTWTKFYKQDENAQNAIVSYYAKGCLIALCIDLQMRIKSQSTVSLDNVMLQLWQTTRDTGKGVEVDTIQVLIGSLVGSEVQQGLDDMICGRTDLPVEQLLSGFGVSFNRQCASGQSDKGGQCLTSTSPQVDFGCFLQERDGGLQLIRASEKGSVQLAGLAAGDVIVAINGLKLNLAQVEQKLKLAVINDVWSIHAFRRDELSEFQVTLQASAETTISLRIDNPEQAKKWLAAD